MICWHGEAEVKLSKEDVAQAIENFLNRHEFNDKPYNVRVTDLKRTSKDSKYFAQVEVVRASKEETK